MENAMLIGGVLLGAGMQLQLAPEDYADGSAPMQFTISRVLDHDTNWVVLEGTMQPTASTVWRTGRVQVRLSALCRLLTLHPR